MFVVLLGVACLGLGSAVAAHAQLGIYGTYSASRLSGIDCYSAAPVKCTSGAAGAVFDATTGKYVPTAKGDVNPSGVQGGVYYDFKSYGPVRLGVDLRGGVQRSNKSAVSSGGGQNYTTSDVVLTGVRGSFRTRYTFLSPYAEVLAGYARSNATEPCNASDPNVLICPFQTYDSFVQYEGFVGVDIHVFPFLDLRPVELGIGNMNRIGSGTGDGSVGVKTIAAGIVIRLSK